MNQTGIINGCLELSFGFHTSWRRWVKRLPQPYEHKAEEGCVAQAWSVDKRTKVLSLCLSLPVFACLCLSLLFCLSKKGVRRRKSTATSLKVEVCTAFVVGVGGCGGKESQYTLYVSYSIYYVNYYEFNIILWFTMAFAILGLVFFVWDLYRKIKVIGKCSVNWPESEYISVRERKGKRTFLSDWISILLFKVFLFIIHWTKYAWDIFILLWILN